MLNVGIGEKDWGIGDWDWGIGSGIRK